MKTANDPVPDRKDHTVAHIDPLRQRIWDHVAHSPLHSLWNFEGVPPQIVAKRTFNAFMDDNLLSRAAELGYYFLFALFPTLISASAILGLVARNTTQIYVKLLDYLALVVPHSAFNIVLETFKTTTEASSGGKITLGLAAALWSASVGFSAIQDTLNTVYKVKETRPYWKARGSAILVTLLLSLLITLILATLLGGDFLAHELRDHLTYHSASMAAVMLTRLLSWGAAAGLLVLLFALIYYFAPDRKNKVWHWITPGATIGILGWLFASVAFRIYLHYFPNYSVAYGSLGAVIVLLTWFYITGLMILTGAEINSEIAASVAEKQLKNAGQIPKQATTDPDHPIDCVANPESCEDGKPKQSPALSA